MPPIGFDDIKRDVELYLVGRDQGEHLLHPRSVDVTRPIEPRRASTACGLKKALERAVFFVYVSSFTGLHTRGLCTYGEV